MIKNVSIAEARHNLASLVHELDKKAVIELTRRGKPVAMLVSLREYNRLCAPKTDFWEAYIAFRKRVQLEKLDIDPKIWENVRDTSPGREVNF